MSKKVGQQSIEKVFLRPGEEWVGFYKKLRTETDRIVVILQLTNGKSVGITFPIGPMEEETVRKEFCSVKVGDLIGLLRIPHTKTPILIRKLRNGKNNTGAKIQGQEAKVKHDV